VEPVTVHDVVRVLLRQAVAQDLEALAAVARTRNDERAVDGIAPLILLARHEPRRLGLLGVHDHGEAEHGRLRVRDLRARERAVRAAEDAVVMLDPDVIGRTAALREPVHVLATALESLLGRRVLGAESLAVAIPRLAAVARKPNAA